MSASIKHLACLQRRHLGLPQQETNHHTLLLPQDPSQDLKDLKDLPLNDRRLPITDITGIRNCDSMKIWWSLPKGGSELMSTWTRMRQPFTVNTRLSVFFASSVIEGRYQHFLEEIKIRSVRSDRQISFDLHTILQNSRNSFSLICYPISP